MGKGGTRNSVVSVLHTQNGEVCVGVVKEYALTQVSLILTVLTEI